MNRVQTVIYGISVLALGVYLGVWFSTMLLVDGQTIMFAPDSAYHDVRSIANASIVVFVAGIATLLTLDYRDRVGSGGLFS